MTMTATSMACAVCNTFSYTYTILHRQQASQKPHREFVLLNVLQMWKVDKERLNNLLKASQFVGGSARIRIL